MIVDDEVIVAMDLEYMLADLGHLVVKTANRVDQGMEMARDCEIDIAILDINVRGVPSFPIAEILQGRGIPVIFASGYGNRGLIEDFKGAHILTKPVDMNSLAQMVALVRADLA